MTSTGITFSRSEIAIYYRARIKDLNTKNAEWRAACPIHRGERESFAIDPQTGQWYCHAACGRGGDLLDFEIELTGANFKTAKAEVFRIIGREEDAKPRIVAEYDYTDEFGTVLYQVCRFEPKTFKQRRPDGNGGWRWGLADVRRVPYHLVELIESPIILIAEGERDVDVLREFGFAATCNSGGAGKWRPEFNSLFAGREVCIIPDADPPGWKHALDVARNLVGIAAKLQMMELPGAKDPAEWFAQGHSELELIELLEAPACHQ